MYEVKVSRWGNSLAVRLPKQVAERLALAEGQNLHLAFDGTEIRLRSAVRIPRISLADLVARMNPEDQPETVEWGPDVGAEIID